ncbi:MAG: histidine kinase [Bacteroidota bacterium]
MKISETVKKRLITTAIHVGYWMTILVAMDYNREMLASFMALAYFVYLGYLGLRWLFRQTRTIIQLKNEQKKTELRHLQSQVNPHFFFNMLNNLYGLIEKDTAKAKELVLKLSDMMRYSIYDGQQDFVNLEEEEAYLKNYIELHRMRYHKDIAVDYDIDIDAEGYQVMPLLFIILLENAFKHGVENLRENAFVAIKLTANEKGIWFRVKNNFDQEEHTTQHKGIGLKNLRRRLELVYPNQHELKLKKIENIYQAQLSIYHT